LSLVGGFGDWGGKPSSSTMYGRVVRKREDDGNQRRCRRGGRPKKKKKRPAMKMARIKKKRPTRRRVRKGKTMEKPEVT